MVFGQCQMFKRLINLDITLGDAVTDSEHVPILLH